MGEGVSGCVVSVWFRGVRGVTVGHPCLGAAWARAGGASEAVRSYGTPTATAGNGWNGGSSVHCMGPTVVGVPDRTSGLDSVLNETEGAASQPMRPREGDVERGGLLASAELP